MLWRYAPIYGLIAAVSALHYATGATAHELHDVYRRLYYLPIILAAFAGGLRGGTIAAIVICVAYWPHAFGSFTHDPGRPVEKILEIVLYLVVGVLTGLLVSRGAETQQQLRETADSLSATLETKERMEDELVRTAKLAAVGRLSAGLAHEIRNPLASIKGSAEILGDDFPDGHPKRSLLDTLVREVDRLNGVLTRFLSFARPLPVAAREFHPVEMVEQIAALLSGREEAAERTIRIHAPATELPPIEADPEQLHQVILNLLLNAVQSTPPGGLIEVRFVRLEGPSRVHILFEDDGPGFDPQALENLFTPFFTTREAGTGLGLALSHRIVETHGGRIEAVNRSEGGARVTVELRAL